VQDIIDMCNEIKEKKLTFVLNPNELWDKFDESLRPITGADWHEVKFLDDSGTNLHSSMDTLPSDSGGIYVFVVKPELIPATHLYILYIGRTKDTDKQNLRKRCKEYLKDTRPKVIMMKHLWGKHLHIRYLSLKDNHIITKLENELVKAIFPPCNSEYPGIINKAARAAFM